jgi:hypothetical protein
MTPPSAQTAQPCYDRHDHQVKMLFRAGRPAPCPVSAGLRSLLSPGMTTIWVRRCLRCGHIDARHRWDDPAAAHTAGAPEGRRWWQRHLRRWECADCGSHDFMVERAEHAQ